MEDFLTFYTYGGFFNHVVSLLALSGLATLVVHASSNRGASGELRLLDLTDRLAGLSVGCGSFGFPVRERR